MFINYGEEGYKKGKSWVQNLLCPPLEIGSTFLWPPFKGWTLFVPPPLQLHYDFGRITPPMRGVPKNAIAALKLLIFVIFFQIQSIQMCKFPLIICEGIFQIASILGQFGFWSGQSGQRLKIGTVPTKSGLLAGLLSP